MCSATGIPPYTELAKRLTTLENKVDALCPKILEGCSKLMDEKGVAAGNISKNMLETLIRKLIRDVQEETRAACGVGNAHASPVVSPANTEQ